MKQFVFVILLLNLNFVTAQQNLVKYVKPIIGSEKMGHTYPGATVPFGAVQLSPETDTISYELNGKYNGEVYKYCAHHGNQNILLPACNLTDTLSRGKFQGKFLPARHDICHIARLFPT